MTKKEIYESNGITLVNGRINSPYGLINPVLVNGNSKLGNGVYTFSTLPTNKEYTITVNGMDFVVKGTCPCHCVGCYATKGNYNFKSVKNSLGVKTLLATFHIDFLKRAIISQIIADNIKIIRVHASGDFHSDEYINMWHEIAEMFPNVVMWTYTKNTQAEHAFDDLNNFNVVKSVISGKGFNFGHIDYILSLYEHLTNIGKSVYVCRCGIDKNQHCTNCHSCAENDYVLFLEHGTSYKPEKDPLYSDFIKLVESQNNAAKAAN